MAISIHRMCYAAECSWKLVDLEHASRDGREAAEHGPGRYASPEFSQAKKHSRTPFDLVPSTDMWSFGVIAFEVLTCASSLSSNGLPMRPASVCLRFFGRRFQRHYGVHR